MNARKSVERLRQEMFAAARAYAAAVAAFATWEVGTTEELEHALANTQAVLQSAARLWAEAHSNEVVRRALLARSAV